MRRGLSPALALACAGLCALGCDDRRRARVDGTDPRPDRGALDAGADGAPPDMIPPDAEPARDMAPDPDLAVDATPDLAVDAAPDMTPDAAPDPALFYGATLHDGRSGCPAVGVAESDFDGRPHWWIAAPIAHFGEAVGDRLIRVPIPLHTGPSDPQTLGPGGGRFDAVRLDGDAAFGLWRDPEAGQPYAGAWRDDDTGWQTAAMPDGGRVTARPDLFDAVRLDGGGFAALLPKDGWIELYVDLGADAGPFTEALLGGNIRRTRLRADGQGLLVGVSTDDSVTLMAFDLRAEPLWRVQFAAAASGFDIALTPERAALVYIAPDARLATEPTAGYGSPTLEVVGWPDGEHAFGGALHPDPIRAQDPTIAPRDDGWMTAWSRLRVDGDRNRTEIEAALVDAERIAPPLRITRDHGFSFCPAVAPSLDGASMIAWLDTRYGREEILVSRGTFRGWPDLDRPEPTPAPPPFADGCADVINPAVPGLISALDATPVGAGFAAVWADRAGGVWAGPVDADGGRARWTWAGALDGPASDLRIVSTPPDLRVLATVDGQTLGWRLDAREGDAPSPPGLAEVIADGPLSAAGGGPAGLVIVEGDPPTVRWVDGDAPALALPRGATDPVVQSVTDGYVVAWIEQAAPEIRVGVLELPPPPAWADAAPISATVRGYTEIEDLSIRPDGDGWRLIFSAHRGRRYARAILEGRLDVRGEINVRPLDLDAASSTRPVGHATGTVWIEERPIERRQVHFAPADPRAPVERLPLPGPERARLFLTADGADPVVLWTAGAEARVARFTAECRLPAASAP